MTYSDECALACYEKIASINENHGVFLVQHKRSKNIYVKKTLTIYNASVYQCLTEHHIRGTPEIYEVVEDDGKLIVIEEYISGNTLKSVLDNGNCFLEREALTIIRQLCAILRDLHNASPTIIHRDVKPSNIILTSDGDVKLIDMNAAKVWVIDKAEDTALIGTAGYAAPEQYGFGSSGVQADIYSVGVLLNVLLTGESPKKQIYQGQLGRVIHKCTMMDPKDRYKTIDELIADLEHIETPGSAKHYHTYKYMIPGFRTGNPTNIIVAILGYGLILLLGFTLTVQSAHTAALLWLNRLFFIACAIMTVLFTCNYMNIWKLFGLDKIRRTFVKCMAVLAIDAAAVLLLLIIMVIIESSI